MKSHRISTLLACLLLSASTGKMLAVPFTPINDPLGVGVNGTLAEGVSGSNVVGLYSAPTQNQGFIYNMVTGSWTTIVDPQTGSLTNEAFGIAGSKIVGLASDSAGTHGFLLDTSSNQWQLLDDPLANNVSNGRDIGTYSRGIDGNNIVGYYFDTSFLGTGHGFLYNTATGLWTTLTEPNAGRDGTFATGISGNIVVGWYDDINRTQFGFEYNIATNAWTTLSYFPLGVQGNKTVGYYYDAQGHSHSFFSDGSAFITLDDPNVDPLLSTTATGIDGDTVVGYYANGFHGDSGFIATVPVPEPASLLLLSIAGIAVGTRQRAAKK